MLENTIIRTFFIYLYLLQLSQALQSFLSRASNSISRFVGQSVSWLISPSISPSIGRSIGCWLRGARNLWQLTFFFFNRSGKVNHDYDDKNLGHNDHIGSDDADDDDDDDDDALADLKRWAYH